MSVISVRTSIKLQRINVPTSLQALKDACVDFIVAPFEADAQMAYLAINGLVHAVITEDSDLLPYGCPRVSMYLLHQHIGISMVTSPCMAVMPYITSNHSNFSNHVF